MAIVDVEFDAFLRIEKVRTGRRLMDEEVERLRSAFTAGRSAQRKYLSHAAGQEAEKEGDRLNFRRQMADAEHYQREFAATTRRIIDEQNAAPAQAPINPAEIDRKLVGGEAVAVVANRFGDPEAFAERELRVLIDIQKLPIGTNFYLTPAQPPASAEVGRFANLLDEARSTLVYTAHRMSERKMGTSEIELVVSRIDAAMAASSGRKGDEMP